jgi:hypothetical protein
MDSRICLVLNKHWKPVSFCSAYHGISKMLNERALMITMPDYQLVDGKSWMEMATDEDTGGILTTRGYLPAPEVIVAKFFERVFYRHPSCNRKNLLKRDGLRCQYTGQPLERHNATIDHLLPRSRGGKTEWDNCVVTSFNFNNKKGARTPEEINHKPMCNPSKPVWGLIDYLPENIVIPDSWKHFIKIKNNEQ